MPHIARALCMPGVSHSFFPSIALQCLANPLHRWLYATFQPQTDCRPGRKREKRGNRASPFSVGARPCETSLPKSCWPGRCSQTHALPGQAWVSPAGCRRTPRSLKADLPHSPVLFLFSLCCQLTTFPETVGSMFTHCSMCFPEQYTVSKSFFSLLFRFSGNSSRTANWYSNLDSYTSERSLKFLGRR